MNHLNDEFLTIKEAAARYNIPYTTMVRNIALGHITHYKIEGSTCIRLKAADLERELRHEAEPNSPKPACLRVLEEEAR